MGLLDALKAFANAVDMEYDRRVRAASNVKRYRVGGHGIQNGHDAQHVPLNEYQRLQGEGGGLGDLQAHAGPQLHQSQGE
jgi:hypothetical protein